MKRPFRSADRIREVPQDPAARAVFIPMRLLLAIALLLLAAAIPSRAAEPASGTPAPIVAAPVDHVVVYSDRARVFRASTLTLSSGSLRAPVLDLPATVGVEPELRVERFVKEERKEGPGALGSRTQLRHRYLIEVGNWSRVAQRVRVVENIPVSRERAVSVSLDPETTAPSRFQREDGHLTWELALSPRAKGRVLLGYTITVPVSYEVTGY